MKTLIYTEQLQKLEMVVSNIHLVGSEKQIKWATDILNARIKSIKILRERKSITEIEIAELALNCCFIRSAITIKTDAKFWINEQSEPLNALGRLFKKEDMRPYFEGAGLKF